MVLLFGKRTVWWIPRFTRNDKQGLVPPGRIIQQHGLVYDPVARGFSDMVRGIRVQEVRSVNQIRDKALPKGLRP